MATENELAKALAERFIQSIRGSFSPCPLIGPKWFSFRDGAAAEFAFTGLAKLAKAIGKPPRVIASIVIKNLNLSGLPAAGVPVVDENGISVPINKGASR